MSRRTTGGRRLLSDLADRDVAPSDSLRDRHGLLTIQFFLATREEVLALAVDQIWRDVVTERDGIVVQARQPYSHSERVILAVGRRPKPAIKLITSSPSNRPGCSHRL